MQEDNLGASLNLWRTNIVATVLYWNAIGCIFSIFAFLFDGYNYMNSVYESQFGVRSVTDAQKFTIMGFGEINDVSIILVVLFSVCITWWGVGLSWVLLPLILSATLFFVPFFFFLFALAMAWMERKNLNDGQTPYPTRKRLVFWVGYTLAVPFVAQCMNMLLQRRDYLMNCTVFVVVAVLGVCSIAIEMVQTIYEHACSDKTINAKKQRELQIFYIKKNQMIRVIMFCTGVLVIGVFFCTFPVFPSTPFSNAYTTVALVAFILALPLISSSRHVVEVGSLQTNAFFLMMDLTLAKNECVQHVGKDRLHVPSPYWDTWSTELGKVELAARCIFTLAVVCDVWSLRMVDSYDIIVTQ